MPDPLGEVNATYGQRDARLGAVRSHTRGMTTDGPTAPDAECHASEYRRTERARDQPLGSDGRLVAPVPAILARVRPDRWVHHLGSVGSGDDRLRRPGRAVTTGRPLHPARDARSVRDLRDQPAARRRGDVGLGRARLLRGVGAVDDQSLGPCHSRGRPDRGDGRAPRRRRSAEARLHHPVPVPTGDGRLRVRAGHLRVRESAPEASRPGEGRGKHPPSARSHHPQPRQRKRHDADRRARRPGAAVGSGEACAAGPRRPGGPRARHRAQRAARPRQSWRGHHRRHPDRTSLVRRSPMCAWTISGCSSRRPSA